MARILTDEEIKENLQIARKKERDKRSKQKAQGKDFVNNGQGVIPESVWKNLPGKQLGDPEAVE